MSSPSLQRSSKGLGMGSPATSPARDLRSSLTSSPPLGQSGNMSPSSNGTPRASRSNSVFFRKPTIRSVLTGSSGNNAGALNESSGANSSGSGLGGGAVELVPAADMSTPEALIAALQQVRLTAENLIRLGPYPKTLTLMWLTEFTTRGGLRDLLDYMKDYKRNTPDHEMRLLILRQCAMFLSEYLKREDDEPEGVLCLELDAADEVWRVLDERPALLRQFIVYLRSTSGENSNARLVADLRIAILGILAQLVARTKDSAEPKFLSLLHAGIYPTLLWLRRRWRANDALFSATLALETALFDAYELSLARSFATSSKPRNAPSSLSVSQSTNLAASASVPVPTRPPQLVVLDGNIAIQPVATPTSSTAAPAASLTMSPALSADETRKSTTKRRAKSVRVQLSAASHVGYLNLPYSSSATVDSLKRAAIRGGAALLHHHHQRKGGVSTSSASSTSSLSTDDEVSDIDAACYSLHTSPSASSSTALADAAKLGDAGVEVDSLLYLCRNAATVQVTSLIHGKQETITLQCAASLDFETVESIRAQCAQRIAHPLADQCRIYAPLALGTQYELCEASRSLGSLPEGLPLQFKLPPRQVKIAFNDGTFVFIGVNEGMPLMQLLAQLAKKRSIADARLKDYGLFVDDDSGSGGFWLDDSSSNSDLSASSKKRSVTYLFEHSDDHLSVRFVPRAHNVRLQLELSDTKGVLRRGHVLELFFDTPVSAAIATICDQLSLTQSPHDLALVHKKKREDPATTDDGSLISSEMLTPRDDDEPAAAGSTSTTNGSVDGAAAAGADTPREPSEVPLLGWVSLRNQGIEKDDVLVLRLRTNTTAADPNRLDIWKEEESAETVQYGEEVDRALNVRPIIAATLNRLVSYLTSDSAHDIGFANTFMYAHRTFAPSEVIIAKFVERFKVPPTQDENATFIVQMRVCIALKRFLEMYVECAGDPQKGPLETVRAFVESTVSKTRQCERIAPILLRQVDQALVRVDEARTALQKIDDEAAAADEPHEGSEPARRQRMMPNKLGMSFATLSIDELARCITVEDFALFEKIEPREYFDAAWTRKRRALAPNLRAFIDRFNLLSAWVSSTIVSAPLLRERVRLFERFIQLTTALLELQNFSALMAIISGLNNSSILRLKWTKSKLAKRSVQLLAEYEALMNMEGSFQRYRRAIKKCAPPLVPYVGVSLMDLTFIDEGNPDNIGALINFAKRRLVVDVVLQLESFSQPYELPMSKEIQFYFRNLPVLSDKECYALSLEIEPRGVTDAKELK